MSDAESPCHGTRVRSRRGAATGAIIMIAELYHTSGRYPLVTMRIGGRQGSAPIFENA